MTSDDISNHWKPTASTQALGSRADLLKRIRCFFSGRNILEVETPVLSSAGNSDPGITQFSTRDGAMWMRTSPEYAMKRLLSAGSGDIYELGRVFRQGESGRHHNLEFTMLEWYRLGWTYHQLMDEVLELVRYCLPGCSFRESKASYREVLMAFTGLDPSNASNQELEKYLRSKGLEIPGLSRSGMLDLLVSHCVQPVLPRDGLTLIYDYPPVQAALARLRHDQSPVAERFELFLGQAELANGYQELTDPEEQEERFLQENLKRDEQGLTAVPLDRRLLSALRSGLPECSGVALGVDRLLMYSLGVDSLSDVMAFPDTRT
jgi:lysyl-tRNA synthetase class 2